MSQENWTAKGEGIETIERLQTAWLDGEQVDIVRVYHDADGVKRAMVRGLYTPLRSLPYSWVS